MVATYHEYLIEDYHRTRAVADGSLVLVRLTGEHAGRRVEHPRCPADHPVTQTIGSRVRATAQTVEPIQTSHPGLFRLDTAATTTVTYMSDTG